jgi:hypothetical protein
MNHIGLEVAHQLTQSRGRYGIRKRRMVSLAMRTSKRWKQGAQLAESMDVDFVIRLSSRQIRLIDRGDRHRMSARAKLAPQKGDLAMGSADKGRIVVTGKENSQFGNLPRFTGDSPRRTQCCW